MKKLYPRGKLKNDDEGQLAIKVYEKDKTVLIEFGKNVSWLGLDKFTALNLAEALIKHANKIITD